MGNNPINFVDPRGTSPLHRALDVYHVYEFIQLLYGNEIWGGEDEWIRNRDREDLYRRIDQLEPDIQDTSTRLDELIRDLERRRQWERDNGLRPPCQ